MYTHIRIHIYTYLVCVEVVVPVWQSQPSHPNLEQRPVRVLVIWPFATVEKDVDAELGMEPMGTQVGLYNTFFLLRVVRARINRPFFRTAHLHCPHWCNTIARRLGKIRPPTTCLVYAIHHTILAMTISCTGQDTG